MQDKCPNNTNISTLYNLFAFFSCGFEVTLISHFLLQVLPSLNRKRKKVKLLLFQQNGHFVQRVGCFGPGNFVSEKLISLLIGWYSIQIIVAN